MAQLIILLIALWVLWGICYMIFRIVSIVRNGILCLAREYDWPIYDKTKDEENRFRNVNAKFGI